MHSVIKRQHNDLEQESNKRYVDTGENNLSTYFVSKFVCSMWEEAEITEMSV